MFTTQFEVILKMSGYHVSYDSPWQRGKTTFRKIQLFSDDSLFTIDQTINSLNEEKYSLNLNFREIGVFTSKDELEKAISELL